MSANSMDKLQVVVMGGGHYIEVPNHRSGELLAYLRSRCIPSSPPQSLTSSTDSIEIGKGVDVSRVQAILDQWS